MKKNYIKLLFLTLLLLNNACNDEWKGEQYENYISFKAPLGSQGVSDIYVRYREASPSTYQLPLIVSGSLTHSKDLTVRVGIDLDTLNVLNFERFQNREDFYYRPLTNNYYEFSSTVNFKSGDNVALLPLHFNLKDIDLVDKWVLPLTILEDPSYRANPRKHYRKALLRVHPFNDYSGKYSGTALKTNMKGYEGETPIVKSEIRSYVVDENTIFFYAGNIDEDRKDRSNYKVFVTFNETGGVSIYANNPAMKFKLKKDASYTVNEQMDAVRPYLMHRYITINNIDYEFTDYTMIPNVNIEYLVNGSLILERKLNTQIPDEDQAIQW